MTSRANGRGASGRSVVYIDGEAMNRRMDEMNRRMGEMNRRMGEMNDTLIRVEAEGKAAKTGWDKVEKRVSRLEPRVWAFPTLGGLVGIAALFVSIMKTTGG